MSDPDNPITIALCEIAEQAAPPRPRIDAAWRAGRRRRRAAISTLAAGTMAAVTAAVLIPLALFGAPAHPAPGPPSSGSASTRHRAAVVLSEPAAPPRPGQFVYAETKSAGGRLYQIWQSADGKQPGLIRNGQGRFILPACTVAQAQANHCSESAGYLPQMPTRPDALRAFLRSIGVIETPPSGFQAPRNWAANDTGKAVDSMMSNTYLLPAQRAALFRLLARTPGFTVIHGVRDAIGRPGVAIRWTYEGGTAEIILNPATFAYLGDRTICPANSPLAQQCRSQYDGSALIKLAFVNRAGQLP